MKSIARKFFLLKGNNTKEIDIRVWKKKSKNGIIEKIYT